MSFEQTFCKGSFVCLRDFPCHRKGGQTCSQCTYSPAEYGEKTSGLFRYHGPQLLLVRRSKPIAQTQLCYELFFMYISSRSSWLAPFFFSLLIIHSFLYALSTSILVLLFQERSLLMIVPRIFNSSTASISVSSSFHSGWKSNFLVGLNTMNLVLSRFNFM